MSSQQALIASPGMLKDFYCNACNCLLSVPPIRLIENHHVCGRCPGEGFREVLLEKLASHFQFPCRYVERGCKLNLIWSEVDKHEQLCDYKLMKCLVSSCVWEGLKMEFIQHLKSLHESQNLNEKDSIMLSNVDFAKYYYFLGSEAAFEIEIENSEELVLITYKVTALWSKADASSYAYQITFFNGQFNLSLIHNADMFGVASYMDKRNIKRVTDNLDEIQVNIKINAPALMNIKRFCVECPKCFAPLYEDTYIGKCGDSICRTCASGDCLQRYFSCPSHSVVNEKYVKNHTMNEFLDSLSFSLK